MSASDLLSVALGSNLHLAGAVNGAPNPLVGAAATDIAAHSSVNIFVRGMRQLGQQCRRCHDLPRLAVPALRHVLFNPGALHRVAAIGPSMVVTCAPATLEARVMQERTGPPLRWTVHAPHCPMPQPNLVPVRLRVSRSNQSKGISALTSADCGFPLSVN